MIGGGLMIAGVMAAEAPWASPLSSLVPVPVANRAPQVDEEAPNFLLKDSEGFNVTLDQFRGKVVLLNFWATWCGPCKIEMPAMERLYRSFSRKEFEILAVSTDAQGTVVTRPFQQEVGFTFPVLHDADFRIGLQYGARQLPMTFLIDRKGIIRNRIPGARDWSAPAGASCRWYRPTSLTSRVFRSSSSPTFQSEAAFARRSY
ncbi:MAG: TlpA family protein disulfide reductase [Nitrospira sp. NTP1]|nr:TlpA family protein disulfide reductase [Nitrospira sp. NTP1]